MANEITHTVTHTTTKSGVTTTISSTKSITLTGAGNYSNVQAIGTSVEKASFPADLVTEGVGFMTFKNLDATNFVEIYKADDDSGTTKQKLGKMLAGESATFRTDAAAGTDPRIWLKADTASCNVQIKADGT